MSTTTERTHTITDAEYAVLEAALELTGKSHGNYTLADRITANLRTAAPKEWHALAEALDKARAAEDPCQDCSGTGVVSKTCCTGSLARIECGCGGGPIEDDCPTCERRGWVL